MSDKNVTWTQGAIVVSGMFGVCVYGFVLLHSMVVSDRAEASEHLSEAVARRNTQMDRMADLFENYREQNDRDHKEMMTILLSIKHEIK